MQGIKRITAVTAAVIVAAALTGGAALPVPNPVVQGCTGNQVVVGAKGGVLSSYTGLRVVWQGKSGLTGTQDVNTDGPTIVTLAGDDVYKIFLQDTLTGASSAKYVTQKVPCVHGH